MLVGALLGIGIFFFAQGTHSATLDFSPANTTATVDDSVAISLLLNTDGASANAAESHLSFPVSLLEVQSLTKESLFSYWPDDPTYSNIAGTIFFSGGLPHPGYNGSSGNIVTINVKAKAAGTAQICQTSVIITADTDAGSDLSNGTQCATITINSATPTLPPAAPTVTSSTHPDPSQSYNNNAPSFEWILELGVTGFSFTIDQVSDTNPDDISEGLDISTSYANLPDGTWYFHIKAENANGWSDVTHFVIHIDTTAPAVPDAPQVTSTTHPDQNFWYSNAHPAFAWDMSSGITGFSFILDQTSNTIPDNTSEGIDLTTEYANLADGTWYFHIKAENANGWGQVTHFRIHIDTTLPSLTAFVSQGPVTTDTTPGLVAHAQDGGSGITRIEVSIDGGAFIDITTYNGLEYTLPELGIGTHTLTVRAVDGAGNVAEISGTVEIRKKTIPEKIDNTIEKIVPEPIKRIVDSVTKPIQKVVENITKPIQNLFDNLRNNQTVVEDTKQIAEPISRTAAAIGVASAVASLPVGLVNSLFALFRFGYLLISPLFIGRRGKSWGVVVDSITRKAVPRAVVRVLETQFNKLKESQITDQLGRFGFIVDPGDYTLNVERAGYVFPSQLTFLHSFETPEYTGGIIHIDNKKNPNINVTIPIDPEPGHITARSLVWKKIRDFALAFLERINWPMLIIGVGVSLWAMLIVPNTLNALMFLLYIFLGLLKVVRLKITVKSFGTVIDSQTHEPLGIAAVRVFDAHRKVMVTTRITNEEGKFSALIQPGTYYLVVTKSGYGPKQSGVMKLSKSETLAMDVELTKIKRVLNEPGVPLPPSMNPPSVQPPINTPPKV
jgi:hypothetical protein